MSQQKPNFFDSKTLMAVILTTAVWIGWQVHLQKKYPKMDTPVTSTETIKSETSEASPEKSDVLSAAAKPKNDELGEVTPGPEKTWEVDSAAWSFKISSRGMAIKDFTLKKFTDRQGNAIRLGQETEHHLPFETSMTGRSTPLEFAVEKVSETHFVGRAKVNGLEVTKTLVLDESKYKMDSEIKTSGQTDGFIGLTTYMVDPLLKLNGGGFLSPSFEKQELYGLGQESSHRLHLNAEKTEDVTVEKLKVAALGSQYFTQALVDRSDVMGVLKGRTSTQNMSVLALVEHSVLDRSQGLNLNFTFFMGPKDLHLLKSVDQSLIGVVDFGYFAIIGRPILKMLKLFHEGVGNWGIAIILLTILVRMLVLPFNVMSFKSMKAMQVVQPKINALKEKYKEDPARMNQEMMNLFKTHKVNPLGGCFPVLLQIPIFFALYQVLGHSVELYQAPFAFWIHDLSHKDPYYVMPVLMGITMFFQMKLTPTTADPVQAKVMMFMPLMMSVFMLGLPSGLTLYIFISTLFGICQQLYLMKTNPTTAVATTK